MKLYKCTKNIFGFEKRIRKFCCLPSDEGSGLKYTFKSNEFRELRLPSDEGSGLKCHSQLYIYAFDYVFPRMREVD